MRRRIYGNKAAKGDAEKAPHNLLDTLGKPTSVIQRAEL